MTDTSDTSLPETQSDPKPESEHGTTEDSSWLDDASLEYEEVEVEEFDIVSSPNDWNFKTIVDFIGSGAIKIPTFQRNYIWDIRRASKLVESLLLGLPIPQVFLYEQSRNDFIVIDGQQRLMTLFFYQHGRFPRKRARAELRKYLGEGSLDQAILDNDDLFQPFKLSLPSRPGQARSPYHGKTYLGLGDDKIGLDLRTLRNVVVKQTHPQGTSAVFEIFNRLNTGGVNLSPQEIRASLYNSQLIHAVLDFNLDDTWRHIVGQPSPDDRMKDSEFLLRSLALARNIDGFTGSLTNFINTFCEQARQYTGAQADGAIQSLRDFTKPFESVTTETFQRSRGKFSGVLFESAFAGWVRADTPSIGIDRMVQTINGIKESDAFASTLQEGSTKPSNVKKRVALFNDAFTVEAQT